MEKYMLYAILQVHPLNISEAGRHSDGGVLSHSVFGKALETNITLSIPPSSPVLYYFCIENTSVDQF